MNREYFGMLTKLMGLLFCLLLSSCSYYSTLYQSSSQNVPLITSKNEGRIEAGTGTQNAGIQAAYGIANHLAAMGSFSYGQVNFPNFFGFISDGGTTSGYRMGGDLALGYFTKLDSNKSFEIFGGFERYHRSYDGDSYPEGYMNTFTVSSNMTKPFIQADLGFQIRSWLQLGLSCRVGYLYFDHYLENGTNMDSTLIAKNFSITKNLNFSVIDPAITLRLGRKNLKFMFQYGFSFASEYEHSAYYNVGLSYRFQIKHPKTSKEPKKRKTNFGN